MSRRNIIQFDKTETWSDVKTENGHNPFWLYCIAEHDLCVTGPCKVGVATDPSKRLSNLQCGNWRPLIVVWLIRLWDRDAALAVEEHCLLRYRPSSYDVRDVRVRLQSEWLAIAPNTLRATAVEYINSRDDEAVRRIC